MTEQEREQVERELILDILIESTKWHIDNDVDDAIRLEVCLRARRLLNIEEIPGETQSVVERGLAKAKAKAEAEQERGTRRVTFPDGSMHRASVEDIYQEPYTRSPTGYRWAVKEQALPKYAAKYGLKLDDKAMQVEAMWQEHKKGEE